jgi:hypothetical protein
MPPAGLNLAECGIARDAVELDRGDELARQVAVEADREFGIAERLQRIEGELAVRAELLVGEFADIGQGAALRPRDELAPTMRPPAVSNSIGMTPSNMPVAVMLLNSICWMKRAASRPTTRNTQAARRGTG